MRAYLRRKRLTEPVVGLHSRARERAKRRGLPFDLDRERIRVPSRCPALDIPLALADERSENSPSLDRLIPSKGYVTDNVRVISDRANRLKAGYSLFELRHLAATAQPARRPEYAKIAAYLERETLLREVEAKATTHLPDAAEWNKVLLFLRRAFRLR